MLQHAVGHRRIIPAYAGSTCCSLEAASTAWDHPRIRGEHTTRSKSMCMLSGSSPHTRGAPSGANLLGRPVLDHPRIRGEH